MADPRGYFDRLAAEPAGTGGRVVRPRRQLGWRPTRPAVDTDETPGAPPPPRTPDNASKFAADKPAPLAPVGAPTEPTTDRTHSRPAPPDAAPKTPGAPTKPGAVGDTTGYMHPAPPAAVDGTAQPFPRENRSAVTISTSSPQAPDTASPVAAMPITARAAWERLSTLSMPAQATAARVDVKHAAAQSISSPPADAPSPHLPSSSRADTGAATPASSPTGPHQPPQPAHVHIGTIEVTIAEPVPQPPLPPPPTPAVSPVPAPTGAGAPRLSRPFTTFGYAQS